VWDGGVWRDRCFRGAELQSDRTMSSKRHAPQPRLDWPFGRQCDRAQSIDDVRDLLHLELGRLGFRYFLCCTHARPDRQAHAAVYLHNYPTEWIGHYRRERHFLKDPVFVIGRDLVYPFRWDDPVFVSRMDGEQRAILAEAATFGLAPGVTMPLHGPFGGSASCSLVPEQGVVDASSVQAAFPFALHAYHRAREILNCAGAPDRLCLPKRERECIELVALGKDDETIAVILGIEPATVRNYLDSAKRRLGVTRRSHAVTLAIYRGAIDVDYLLGN
jgi:DNA-binding CsgD family transcriptional regulator